jgi:predicted metal-dependent hydrolase
MAPSGRASHSTAMTEPVVRRLLIDLQTPPARHWCGGDAFRTAWFNALSMSFPSGEQFFIDSVRAGVQNLPEAERERFEPAIKAFVGQEATHRRIHALFNEHLATRGLINHWEARALRRMRVFEGKDVRGAVGATAATEHLTAIMAEHLLSDPWTLEGAEARFVTLWLWHASEETEHRATAFDVYRALGGNETWRLRLFRIVTMHFLIDALRQTANNLWHDGTLWRFSTWASGWRFLFGRRGVIRTLAAPWRRYRSADFHPAQQDESRAVAWLREHAGQFEVVSRPMAAAGANA